MTNFESTTKMKKSPSIERIQELRDRGLSYRHIAEELRTSYTTVANALGDDKDTYLRLKLLLNELWIIPERNRPCVKRSTTEQEAQSVRVTIGKRPNTLRLK